MRYPALEPFVGATGPPSPLTTLTPPAEDATCQPVLSAAFQKEARDMVPGGPPGPSLSLPQG